MIINRNIDFGPIVPLKQRVVNSMADFPPAAAGVITLEPGVEYVLGEVGITTSDRFVSDGPNNTISGLWTAGPAQLTYTGTGTMFTATDSSMQLFKFVADCPNGDFISTTEIGPALTIFRMSEVVLLSCQNFGMANNMTGFNISNSAALSTVSGLTVLGQTRWQVFSFRQFSFNNMGNGGTAIDFTNSLHNTIELVDMVVNAPGGGPVTGISGLANSANLNANRFASVRACEFGTGVDVVPLSGITTDDVRWLFKDNSNVADTFIRGLLSVSGNLTATTVVTQGVKVPIEGIWTFGNNSQMTAGPSGTSRMTYTGERTLQFSIDASITMLAAAATPLVEVQVYKNGVPIPGAIITRETDTINNSNAGIPWLEELQQDDFIELYLSNEDGTEDIIVTDGIIRMSAM